MLLSVRLVCSQYIYSGTPSVYALLLGYDVSYQYPFSVIGRNEQTLNSRFSPHPETYLTLCTNGFPNWFMSLGPNSGIGSGSLLVIMERQVDYAIAAVRKLQREHLKSIEPKREAVKDFDEYLEVC